MSAAAAWRQNRNEGRGEAQLTAVLAMDLPLLPSEPAAVEEKRADFRLLPVALQRCFPALIEVAMEALHAKFTLLRAAPAAYAGSSASAEAYALRSRAEAIVAFSGLAVWAAAEALGQTHMPGATTKRLAGWLADMA